MEIGFTNNEDLVKRVIGEVLAGRGDSVRFVVFVGEEAATSTGVSGGEVEHIYQINVTTKKGIQFRLTTKRGSKPISEVDLVGGTELTESERAAIKKSAMELIKPRVKGYAVEKAKRTAIEATRETARAADIAYFESRSTTTAAAAAAAAASAAPGYLSGLMSYLPWGSAPASTVAAGAVLAGDLSAGSTKSTRDAALSALDSIAGSKHKSVSKAMVVDYGDRIVVIREGDGTKMYSTGAGFIIPPEVALLTKALKQQTGAGFRPRAGAYGKIGRRVIKNR